MREKPRVHGPEGGDKIADKFKFPRRARAESAGERDGRWREAFGPKCHPRKIALRQKRLHHSLER